LFFVRLTVAQRGNSAAAVKRIGEARADRQRRAPDVFDHSRPVLIVKYDVNLGGSIVLFRRTLIGARWN